MAGIHSRTEPLAAVRSLAEAAANQRGSTFIGSPLRLFDGVRRVDQVETEGKVSPYALGRTYELMLAPMARRSKGAHLTPEAVARQLVAMMGAPTATDRILDPAVGGAAFLLAAIDQLVQAGAEPSQALGQVAGIDIDEGAVWVAEAALGIWSLDAECEVAGVPNISHGDGLLDDLPPAERVVGNPPFLNQLRSSSSHTPDRRAALRDRWDGLIGAYTDDAWLFLAAALQTLSPGGSIAMVQPISLLAARHADAIRQVVHDQAQMTGLWIGRDRVFDAAVQVCGVVLTRTSEPTPGRVERRVGADFEPVQPLTESPAPPDWGRAGATALGVPQVHIAATDRVVGDLAQATAGFRDQFYGFVPYVSEAASKDVKPGSGMAKLVTVGMIDVLGLSWGQRQFKFAKRNVERPVVELDALRQGDPKLGQWADARLRPKLLVATQTRVVEAWVDEQGTALPVTPVLSIEPDDDDPNTLWLLAAALSAPAVSAQSLAAKFGTAMSLNAVKLAARDVLAIPLPSNADAWQAGADLIRDRSASISSAEYAQFAELMGRAYDERDEELARWWLARAEPAPKAR